MSRLAVPAVIAWLLCELAAVSHAQPATNAADAPASQPASVPTATLPALEEWTVEKIEEALRQVQADTGLGENVRGQLQKTYQQAIEQLQTAQRRQSDAKAQEAARGQLAAQIDAARATLAEIAASQPAPEALAAKEQAELEQLLTQANAEQEAAARRLETLAAAIQQQPAQLEDKRRVIDGLQTQLEEVNTKLAAPAAGETPELATAGRAEQTTRKKALEADLAASRAELGYLQDSEPLLRLQRDDAAAKADAAQKRVTAIRAALGRMALFAAREDIRRTDAELHAARQRGEPEELLKLREENLDLLRRRIEPDRALVKSLKVHGQPAELDAALDRIKDQRARLVKRIEQVGLTNTVGLLLRRQRDRLPNVRQFRQELANRQDERTRLSLDRFELEEERAQLDSVPQKVEQLLGRLPADRREAARAEATALLTERRDVLDRLLDDLGKYILTVDELIDKQRTLIDQTEELRSFILERILWVRTASFPSGQDAGEAWRALCWLADPAVWAAAAQALWADACDQPLLYILAALLLGTLLVLRRPAGRAIQRIAQAIRAPVPERFLPSLWVLLLGIPQAVTVAALVGFLSWRLSAAPTGSDAASAVAGGLAAVCIVLLTTRVFQQITRPGGLAEAHLQWSTASMAPLRRAAWQLLFALLPLAFIVAAMEAQSQEAFKSSLGRLAWTAAMLLLTAYAARLLRPGGPVLGSLRTANQSSWVYRLRVLWYVLLIVVPLLLAALSLWGYHYTAVLLGGRFLAQFWLAGAMLLATSLLFLWLKIVRRRLAIREARKRAAAREAQAAAEAERAPGPRPQTEAGLDTSAILSISEQTRRLVRYAVAIVFLAATWAIWDDVLPALNRLRNITLYATDEFAVSLADLLLALLSAVLTVAAARNLPGLIEVIVLQRLPVTAGARYAIVAVSRYVIAVVGAVVVFGFMGVGWGHVQWLVAAMTFGLAFGLQEIFANFVSGLIILFERPIRVGDVVTINNITGTVTRIRMRATTVLDWDRKEMIVPNKEFITHEMINWTLSDRIIRIVIPVGIAYGSDTQLAKKLLLQIADENQDILADPAPAALFLSFGDNSLNFELRVFITGLENFLAVRDRVHFEIDRRFREAGIPIAFPQRDVHLDTANPLVVRLEDRTQRQAGGRRPAEE